MQVGSPDKIRNIALTGHNDTGKTTVASALLYTADVVNRLNRVEDGNTITDFDPSEIERKISIGLATCFLPWQGHKVNLVDCPGYGIFFPETKAGMTATDLTLLCVNGVAGVQVTSEKVWEFARESRIPLAIALTEMDRERADFDRAIEAMQNSFGREVMPIQLPIGSEHEFSGVVDLVHRKAWGFDGDGNGKGTETEIPEEMGDAVEDWRNQLVEMVAESNDELMEKYFEEGSLSGDDLRTGLRRAILERHLFPVTVVSALHGIGSSTLLDAAVELFPDPTERGTFPATTIGGDDKPVETSPEASATALVFKTLNDPQSGKMTLLRVVSGELSSDATLWNAQEEATERIGHLLAMQGKSGSQVQKLVTGDIGGVAKLKSAATGHTLCDKSAPIKLEWIEMPEPAISFAIEPKTKSDEEKIGEALHRLQDEDPTLLAGRDADSGEFLLSGTGQLHVEIAVGKLKQRFHVEVILHPPRVPYLETIRKAAEGHGRHKKQSGGRGQFADCRITLEPTRRGEGYDFVDEIFGGSIPQGFRPAVDKGIREASARGYLAGYKVVDFKVRLQDGQYHDVDSSEMAFKVAGSLAFKDAMAKAAPILLEPIMKVDVTTTEEFMGDIMSDLSQRRGRPQGMEIKDGGQQVVSATVPMSEMLDYAPSLRSMTQDRASFHMEFSHYDPVPKMIQDKLIEEYERSKDD
jgi:elongation factor G